MFGEKKMMSRIIVVVTDEQADQIAGAARDAGKSISTWARDLLLAAVAKPTPADLMAALRDGLMRAPETVQDETAVKDPQ